MKKLNITNLRSLSLALQIPETELVNLAEHTELLYHIDTISKKDGDVRTLAKPKYRLKIAQSRINKLLSKIELPECVHGWVKSKSVKTAVMMHAGMRFLCVFDIRNYFDSIHSTRVYRLFNTELCCSPTVSKLLTPITTFNYCLPQGSPCSPTLANLVLYSFDTAIMRYVEKKQARYSRVGDDMLISSNHLLSDVERVVTVGLKKSGLKTNKKKQNINAHPARSGEKVLGVVIGETVSIARDYRRLVKAILHNAQKTGLAAQNRDRKIHFRQHLQGKIMLIKMYHMAEGIQLEQKLRKIPD